MIATVALIMAVNFAISHAEYIYSTEVFGLDSHSKLESNQSSYSLATLVNPQHAQRLGNAFASDASILPSAPRPNNSFATDGSILPSAPRLNNSFATDGSILPSAQRPNNSFATDGSILPSAPRPNNSFATDGSTLQRALELGNSHALIIMSRQSTPRPS